VEKSTISSRADAERRQRLCDVGMGRAGDGINASQIRARRRLRALWIPWRHSGVGRRMEKDKVLQSWPVANEMQVGKPKEGRRPQLRSARSRRAQKMRPCAVVQTVTQSRI